MKYLIIYLEVKHLLNFLSQIEKGDLLDILIKYAEDEIEPKIENKNVLNVFNFLRSRLDEQFAKAKLKAEVARVNGANGGRPTDKKPKKTKKNPAATQKNPPEPIGLSKYTILADGLIFVLEAKMNKTLPTGSQKNYAEEIRKLIEIDLKVRTEPEEDVKRAIQAISNNYGKDYFPVIQSGGSFREKFVKIEDYLKRNQNSKKTELSDTYCNLMEKFTNEENDNNSEENDNNSMLD